MLLVFVLVGSIGQVSGAAVPSEFVDAALRIVLGIPVVVLMFLPETTAWFEREK